MNTVLSRLFNVTYRRLSPTWFFEISVVPLATLLLLSASASVAATIPTGVDPSHEFGNVGRIGGISADGTTIAGDATWHFSKGTGFVQTGSGPFVRIDTHYDPRVVNAISADGRVVVGTTNIVTHHAFRWTQETGPVDLGSLIPGHSSAAAVSADGSVVVGLSEYKPSHYEAFRWTAATGMVGLGHLPGDGGYSAATGISADGSIIVGNAGDAFRWTEATGMIPFDFGPGRRGAVYGITPDGSMVFGETSDGMNSQAFRWSEATGFEVLGSMRRASHTVALAASADGSIIVGVGMLPGTSMDTFIWDAENGMRRLVDIVVVPPNTYFPRDVNIGRPAGISADGRIVVGNKSDGGIWIYKIPEPSTWSLTFAGIISIMIVRLRFRSGARLKIKSPTLA